MKTKAELTQEFFDALAEYNDAVTEETRLDYGFDFEGKILNTRNKLHSLLNQAFEYQNDGGAP